MSRKDIEEEIQYQKLHGMSRYPNSSGGGCLGKIIAIILVALLIFAFIYFAGQGIKFP